MSTPTPGASPAPVSPPSPPASAPPPTTTPPPIASTPPPTTPVIPPTASSSPPPPPPITPIASPTPPSTIPPKTSPSPPDAPAISPPAPTTPSDSPPSPPATSKPPPSPPANSKSPPPSPPGTTPTPTTPTPGSKGSPSPPLPPSTGKSPPHNPSSTSTPPPPSSSSGVSTGLVIGVAIGGVMMLVFLSLLFVCCKKKRKRRDNGPMGYYGSTPTGPKGNSHGAPPQQWLYDSTPPPPAEHFVSVPSNLTPQPGTGSRLPQSTSSSIEPPPRPPPPPPFMSSGTTGSSYSDYDHSPRPPPPPAISLGFSKSTFTYEELMRATDGFSEANLLGQGGFGYVHKGVLPNGKEVAVKQLKVGSGQGEREFQAEVEIISRVHHKHLVSLVGYCSTGTQRMLVYEFVPNNTLEFHLHGKGRPVMDWATRHRIALGSAKGLAYLHEDCHPKIIHRDIKASNILIDMKFEAKVADFGLAKFSSDTNTHVSTRVMGTFGYLAPEYAASGKLTEKSDVFSFGVMLLELITGRRPVDTTDAYMDDSLVDWARPLLLRAQETGNYNDLIDPKMHYYNPQEMARMVDCAAASVRHSSRRRPQMSQIVRALEGDGSLSDLNEGIRPGHSTVYNSHGSSDYDTFQYNEDMKKFRKIALTSDEYGGSEYSGVQTSEYGLNPSGSSDEGQNTREMQQPGKKRNDGQGFSGTSFS